MNPPASRKQILIAESDLNRAQLFAALDGLQGDIRAVTQRAQSFGAIASSAAVLVAALAAFRQGRVTDAKAKPSWPQAILKGAGLASALWLAIRSSPGGPKGNAPGN